MGRVFAVEELFTTELAYPGMSLAQEWNELLLRMLGAGQQVPVDHPSLNSNVCREEQVPVKLPVGVGYLLFLAIRVIHGKAVDIHGNMAGVDGGKRNFDFLQKLDGGPGDHRKEGRGMFIHPLAHGPLGRDMLVTKSIAKKVIGPKLFYGNEIALGLGQKSTVALDAICVRDDIV